MNNFWTSILRDQFGASIEMLENAIRACPESVWGDRSQTPEFWYVAFHTVFFLDFNMSDPEQAFTPPPPFTLSELDPAGVMPERVFTKEELLTYLEHGRRKFHLKIEGLTEEKARQHCGFERRDMSLAEYLLHSMRHVQHHAAQLNLILRQRTDSAPRWVFSA